MADEVDGVWPSADIPDRDLLYMRVHRNNIQDGVLTAGSFKRHGDGLSTDWAKSRIALTDTC